MCANASSEPQLERLFAHVREARAAGVARSEMWSEMHDLAEAGYEPAVEFFQSFLDDPNWDWRLEGVRLLGFHYLFAAESDIIGKFRQLLLTDPNDFVRSSAAMALGSQLERLRPGPEWPDRALLQAMREDPDKQIRLVAFEKLLSTAGLLFPVVRAEREHVEKTGRRPTIADVKRILREHQIEPETST